MQFGALHLQIKLPAFPPTSKVIFSTLKFFCPPPVGPYARIKLRFKTFKIKYFRAQNIIKMKREVRRIHWYTAEKEKTNDTKVIKDQTYCIFYNLIV
jgi:hypothetical protein